ncbi:hypothetical protein [Staphylococcus warneri]|nr:hypothetical protein [Staphylococcus warneri]
MEVKDGEKKEQVVLVKVESVEENGVAVALYWEEVEEVMVRKWVRKWVV